MDIRKLFDVRGKVVLITGGGRGIGYYIAKGFVVNGATVYITSRDTAACNKVAQELTNSGSPGKCIALPSTDLSTVSACLDLVATLKQHTDKLHVLVNNSGVSWGEPLAKYSEKGWDKVMDVNVKGLFFLTRECVPLLEAAATDADPARIINIGSVAGLNPQPIPTFAYDTSKAAVHHLTRKLASELASKRITANVIAPGAVPSKMSNQLLTYVDEDALKGALGRMGSPEDMAGAAIYLASAAGAWVTGAIIKVDGGGLPSHL